MNELNTQTRLNAASALGKILRGEHDQFPPYFLELIQHAVTSSAKPEDSRSLVYGIREFYHDLSLRPKRDNPSMFDVPERSGTVYKGRRTPEEIEAGHKEHIVIYSAEKGLNGLSVPLRGVEQTYKPSEVPAVNVQSFGDMNRGVTVVTHLSKELPNGAPRITVVPHSKTSLDLADGVARRLNGEISQMVPSIANKVKAEVDLPNHLLKTPSAETRKKFRLVRQLTGRAVSKQRAATAEKSATAARGQATLLSSELNRVQNQLGDTLRKYQELEQLHANRGEALSAAEAKLHNMSVAIGKADHVLEHGDGLGKRGDAIKLARTHLADHLPQEAPRRKH